MTNGPIFTSFQSLQTFRFARSEQPVQGDTPEPKSVVRAEATQSTTLTISTLQRQEDPTYSASKGSGVSVPAVADSEALTGPANTILGFLAGRLNLDALEGATEEQLASRLSAGLEGFVSGYSDAYKQLDEMGFLYEEVEVAIEQTFTDMLDGIDALAESLGVASPVTDALRASQTERRDSFEADVPSDPTAASEAVLAASKNQAPVFAQAPQSLLSSALSAEAALPNKAEIDNLNALLDATTINYQTEERRSFSFSLTTQDGDTVSIRAASASESVLAGQRVRYGDAAAAASAGSVSVSSGFYIDVAGDLDDAELFAIEDVLAQVRDVSDLFFSGDIESAFNAAVELGFDAEEIAEFSLSLRSQSTTRVQETYEQIRDVDTLEKSGVNGVEGLTPQNEKYLVLARFVQALEDMRVDFKRYGIEGFTALPKIEAKDGADVEGSKAEQVGVVQNIASALEAIALRRADTPS